MGVVFLRVGALDTLSYRLSRAPDHDEDATCTLYSEGGAQLETGDADIAPSTTLDAGAAAGQTTVPLTSTDDIEIGEVYTIGPNGIGQHEDVTVSSIVAGVSVTVRHDLIYTYAAADLFESRVLSYDLTVAIASARKNCRARWAYVDLDGIDRVEESIFHVSPYAPVCTVSESDILRRLPDARNWVLPGQPLIELVQDVWEGEVLGDLAVIWSPVATISGDSLRIAAINRVCAQLALANEKPDAYDRYMEEYRADLERSIATMPKDTDSDGASDDELTYNPGSLRIVRC